MLGPLAEFGGGSTLPAKFHLPRVSDTVIAATPPAVVV